MEAKKKGLLVNLSLLLFIPQTPAVISERILRDAGNNRAGNSPTAPRVRHVYSAK